MSKFNWYRQIIDNKYSNWKNYEEAIKWFYFYREYIANEIATLIWKPKTNNKKVLDIVAWTWIISEHLNTNWFKVTSMDLSNNFLKFIKNKKNDINCILSDMNKPFPFKNDSFDYITTMGWNRYITWEWIKNLANESYRTLKDNWKLIFPILLLECFLWRWKWIPFPAISSKIKPIFENSWFNVKKNFIAYNKITWIRQRPTYLVCKK
jgi:hypothetical protein